MTAEQARLEVGARVHWSGQTLVVSNVGAYVSLENEHGLHVLDLPLVDAVANLVTQGAPSPHVLRAHDIESQLSPGALRKFRDARNILSLIERGLDFEDHPSTTPANELDPLRHSRHRRITNLAQIRAQKIRTSGASKGSTVDVNSERRLIERTLERYRHHGLPGLVDQRYLRPRRGRQDEAIWTALTDLLVRETTRSTKSIRALVRLFIIEQELAGSSLALPAPNTLWKMVKTLQVENAETLTGSASARRSALNRPRPSPQRRTTSRPGELVLFDTTKANVWVTDPKTGRAYRPEITMALDHYTRAIVGMSIAVTTSGVGVTLCLADVLLPKSADRVQDWSAPGDELYPQPFVGVPGEWGHITGFTPEAMVVDNGKPFLSSYSTSVVAELGIDYEPQRSYTPTDKPQIERAFRSVKDRFEALMAGYTGGSVHDKGDDPAGEQLWSGALYERRLRQCIDVHNNTVNTGLALEGDPFTPVSPVMMWEHAVRRDGHVPVPAWRDQWIRFLPSVEAKVNRKGVKVKRIQFESPDVLEMLKQDPRSATGGVIRVFYNPADLRTAFCFDPDGTAHVLRCSFWTPELPRFGEVATNQAVASLGSRALSGRELEAALVRLAVSWARADASNEVVSHRDVIDLADYRPSLDEATAHINEALIGDQIASIRERSEGAAKGGAADQLTPSRPGGPIAEEEGPSNVVPIGSTRPVDVYRPAYGGWGDL